jgi:hypothetical protein
MLPTDQGQPARSLTLRRYGPLAVIVVMLLVVGALLVMGGDDDEPEADTAADLAWTSVEGVEPGAPAPTGRMPVTYAEAEEDGSAGDHEWPDTCDTERGTVRIPSVYAAPCVPAFEGDNGGATATGVTADTVRVVFYAPEESADLASLLGGMGADDSAEERTETLQQYLDLYASVTEQYGRRIELVPFAATGAPDDVVAARADATDVIALEPFAVIGGPVLDRGTFAQELAEAGVLCLGCGTSLPDDMVRDMAPYVWDGPPSPDQILDLLGTWVGEVGSNDIDTADLAGGDLRGDPRKIGVIHFEQDPPIYGAMRDERSEEVAAAALIESYVLDLPALPAKAAELVAQFKSEGITTILFLGDPIMPLYLTEAATAQGYYPEWLFAGTALTDTNLFGRQYDQAQMAHAFGISQLPAPTEQDLQTVIRNYRWYYGDEDALPPARSQYALIAPSAEWLVDGIHMAGPDLTPETFARGIFRIPPAGGGPANPQVSYGNWGMFPEVDYQGIDDAVEIWWDPDVEVEDERGAPGVGVWRRSAGGERFTVTDPPTPNAFADVDQSVTVIDELEGEDEPPDYPPPAGSPAARAS